MSSVGEAEGKFGVATSSGTIKDTEAPSAEMSGNQNIKILIHPAKEFSLYLNLLQGNMFIKTETSVKIMAFISLTKFYKTKIKELQSQIQLYV